MWLSRIRKNYMRKQYNEHTLVLYFIPFSLLLAFRSFCTMFLYLLRSLLLVLQSCNNSFRLCFTWVQIAVRNYYPRSGFTPVRQGQYSHKLRLALLYNRIALHFAKTLDCKCLSQIHLNQLFVKVTLITPGQLKLLSNTAE